MPHIRHDSCWSIDKRMRATPQSTVWTPSPARLASWVETWGGAWSTALYDSRSELFRAPGLEGGIAYRRGLGGCAVAMGDPVCAPADRRALVELFRRHNAATVFVGASEPFAQLAESMGFATVELGAEVVFDPWQDPCAGKRTY